VRSRSKRLLGAGLAAGLLTVAASACGSSSSAPPHNAATSASTTVASHGPGYGKPAVTLGTKNFTEELILGQLYAQALQAKGFPVTLKSNLGASERVARELTSGKIDGYPEYTGTILSVVAHDSRRPASAADAYARAARFEREHGAELLAMAPAQDTDVLVTTPAYAAQHRLNSVADLARLGPSTTLAGPPEFSTRYDGMIGLHEAYGVSEIHFVPVSIGGQYAALRAGHAQVVAVFTTDGELSQGGFTLLKDPKNIFGFQNVAFVVRHGVLGREGPAFAQTLNAVSAKLSTQALRVMNAAVELDQQSPEAVARQFLAANNLL
jgi:osmoprotectant transport system substrate-binding protein